MTTDGSLSIRTGRAGWRVLLALVVGLATLASLPTLADEDARKPANVDAEAHTWFAEHIDDAMPFLLQTPLGPIDLEHISIVEELGNWGAARSKGGHQGNDFVLDMPHTSGSDRVLVGTVVAGRVAHLEPGWGAYGNTVFIHRETTPQLVVIYAHLASIDVAVGDAVQVGDILGDFGCTGNCTGLSGKHVRNQVHVEVYVMPDDFQAADLNWTELPMRQLRSLAVKTHRGTDGVDIAAYFDAFALAPVTRHDHGTRYQKNEDDGGFATYLANEDLDRVMELTTNPPVQVGVVGGDHIAEPNEDAFYDDDDQIAEDLLARQVALAPTGAAAAAAGDENIALRVAASVSALEHGRFAARRLPELVAAASRRLAGAHAHPVDEK